jgi:DNA-binding transcriptional ArsR family regulator
VSSAAEPAPGSGFELLRDPSVLRTLANPSRMRIYVATVERAYSAKELAERFEQPLARVSYHMRTLADAGLLRAVRHTRRRGAIETHYRAIATLDISDEVIAEAGPEAVAYFAQAMIRDVAEDTLDALQHGAAAEPDFFLARAHFKATQEGRERLFAELLAIYERLGALEAELRRDAEASGEEPHEVNLTIGFYEGERRAERNGPFVMGSTPEGEAERLLSQIPPPATAT